jgi:hypothetical protein
VPLNDRLRVKRGDTAPGFRAQCRNGSDPANLTGATARLLLRGDSDLIAASFPLTVEPGTDGWVSRDWQAGDLATVGTRRGEVEVTYSAGGRQTFPGAGYFTLEILGDLG